jgi:PurA ssDNA and RNA-binding protein
MYEENNDSSYSHAYRQYSRDNVLESRELQVERKFFRLEVRENDRGRFLRITEENQGRRNTVIVPCSGCFGSSQGSAGFLIPPFPRQQSS